MFGTAFILHILQQGLLVLCSVGCLNLKMNIHSLLPLPIWLQHAESIENACGNEMFASCWRHFSVVFGKLQSSSLYSEEQVFFPSSVLLGQSWHHANHVIVHVIVQCHNLMQCDCTPLRHANGPLTKWPHYFDGILDNFPFILRCE
jgi:hypothetical protein